MSIGTALGHEPWPFTGNDILDALPVLPRCTHTQWLAVVEERRSSIQGLRRIAARKLVRVPAYGCQSVGAAHGEAHCPIEDG